MAEGDKFRVEARGIGEIIPYENNPRDNSYAVDKVAQSIRKFGWQQPIVVDIDGVIVAGHTRYEAAKRLGLDTVPVHVASDLTPEEIQAYRLADNKTTEFSTWDFGKLQEELDGISSIDMTDFGFDDFDIDIDDLFSQPEGDGGDEDEPDDEDEGESVTTCPVCGARFDANGNVVEGDGDQQGMVEP